jgi:hypothetical protein
MGTRRSASLGRTQQSRSSRRTGREALPRCGCIGNKPQCRPCCFRPAPPVGATALFATQPTIGQPELQPDLVQTARSSDARLMALRAQWTQCMVESARALPDPINEWIIGGVRRCLRRPRQSPDALLAIIPRRHTRRSPGCPITTRRSCVKTQERLGRYRLRRRPICTNYHWPHILQGYPAF